MNEPQSNPIVPMNDLSRGIQRDHELLRVALNEVLASGHVIMGPQHTLFEQDLARYLDVAHTIGVASGTDALELAIKATMPEGRHTVITAANAGGYTSIAATRAGFRVAYADVDERTLCLSGATVSEAITDDVGVVVVTHLYGNLTDFDDLVELCHAHNIRVVEDCAQAIGANRDGKYAGSFGDIATTSFYPTKNLGAIGDGGAVITNDDRLAATVRQLRQYGWSEKYHVDVAGGINSRLDELQAAFLRVRLPLLDSFNERRREIVARYNASASGTSIEVLPAPDRSHVAHLAVARSSRREEVRAALLDVGVRTEIHFPIPDHRQVAWEAPAVHLPVTERAVQEVFSLPCFPELTDAEVATVCRAIERVR